MDGLAAITAAAALAFALLAAFPYSIYPLTLRLFRVRPVRIDPAASPPSATLVFCAYNEEASALAKLDNLRAIRRVWPSMRFACFVDRSSDRTLELFGAHPDLVTVHAAPARVGKATGMARMMAACDSEIVIFTDANVMLDPASVPALLAYFSDPEVGGVCGTLHYTNPDDGVAAATSSAYWRLEERIKRLESRSGSTMGADGSIFATRRALYPVVPAHLLDDMIVSMSVIFAGYRLVSAPDVHAYESAVTASEAEFRRRRRIACRAYLSHAFIRRRVLALPWRDIYKYAGHKLIRWYSVWFGLLAAGFGLAALAMVSGPAALAAAGFAAGAVAASVRVRFVQLLREASGQFWAAGLGMIDAWRGRRYQTWDTPADRVPVTATRAGETG